MGHRITWLSFCVCLPLIFDLVNSSRNIRIGKNEINLHYSLLCREQRRLCPVRCVIRVTSFVICKTFAKVPKSDRNCSYITAQNQMYLYIPWSYSCQSVLVTNKLLSQSEIPLPLYRFWESTGDIALADPAFTRSPVWCHTLSLSVSQEYLVVRVRPHLPWNVWYSFRRQVENHCENFLQ